MDLKIPTLDNIKGIKGIKEKMGFGEQPASTRSRGAHSSRVDSYEEEDYGYEDYGEYAFDDTADYAQPFNNEAPVAAAHGIGSSFSPQLPKLVTADDVRAHTQYTPAEPEDLDEPELPVGEQNALQNEEQRSAGLSGLFDPNTSQKTAAMPPVAPAASATGAVAPAEKGTVPSVSSIEDVRVVQRATRILTIIKPESYAEAERIPKILKSGDVAVLSLRNTPDALGKRILDFSFGVACALDARVECVSGHVFAITRGIGLTDGETARLRDQGLM